MDNNHIMTKEKLLGFCGIFKETLKLPIKNPSLILVFLITSFPLVFFLVIKEIIVDQSFRQVFDFFSYLDWHSSSYWSSLLSSITELIENVSPIRLLSSLLLLGIVHLLDLLYTVIIVYTASVMYTGDQANLANYKQMLCSPIKKVGFRGPLITSIWVHILSSLTLIWLVILAIILIMTTHIPSSMLIFGAVYLVSFAKYFEWTSIWYMSMVIAILEEKHGGVAIGISRYLTKGSRKRGFLLAFVLYVWNDHISKLIYYKHKFRGGIGDLVEATAGKVWMHRVGYFMMWVGFVVYFYDCKKRLLEKKSDGALGKNAQIVKV